MRSLAGAIGAGSRSISYLLGGVVLVLAIAAALTPLDAAQVADWAHRVFGWAYITLLGVLVFATLVCWTQMQRGDDGRMWFEAGMHTSSGIAILALTFTLIGVSLGVGTLAEQELTPATVQSVISQLSAHFSLAFMTTVVGLPTSAVMRALISITEARMPIRQAQVMGHQLKGIVR
jgi:cytochrome b561